MKPHTYSFNARNLITKELVSATIEATGTSQAIEAAQVDTRFKGHKVLWDSFRRTDTAKGANRAGGLDSNGKQLDSRHFSKSFDRYDVRVRNALTKLALIKPPKGSSEQNVRKYLRERLAEFGII